MPFRFRKSFKIAKGLKINLSKSGISTTIRGRGASVNLSKRGTRTTVGLPGTGLSVSSPTSAPAKTAPRQERRVPEKKGNQGSSCLTSLPGFIFLPFHVVTDLVKSISNPETRRSTLILVGVLLGSCFTCFGAATLVEGTSSLNTPVPIVDVNAIATNAVLKAWLPYTQTAAALPTMTFTQTPLPLPTDTLLPTQTPEPTFTPLSLPRNTLAVIVPQQPAQAACSCSGDTLNCGDLGTHSNAQACFEYCLAQGVGDIHGLDGNNDGVACESLP
jgi:hypothetical protein